MGSLGSVFGARFFAEYSFLSRKFHVIANRTNTVSAAVRECVWIFDRLHTFNGNEKEMHKSN